jgi:biopolymer transport protein ExbD
MSEDNKEFRIIKAKPRSKKLKPTIDFAAMVSVSFLLIIFFMVTQELSRPQMMDFGMPERSCGPDDGGCDRGLSQRTITLLLDDDNKVISYMGFLVSDENNKLINYNPLLDYKEDQPRKFGYGKDIRKELTVMQAGIFEKTRDHDKGAIVIIKPSKKCNYGNLVDILDEMAITKIGTYAIINDINPEEQKLLASN